MSEAKLAEQIEAVEHFLDDEWPMPDCETAVAAVAEWVRRMYTSGENGDVAASDAMADRVVELVCRLEDWTNE